MRKCAANALSIWQGAFTTIFEKLVFEKLTALNIESCQLVSVSRAAVISIANVAGEMPIITVALHRVENRNWSVEVYYRGRGGGSREQFQGTSVLLALSLFSCYVILQEKT